MAKCKPEVFEGKENQKTAKNGCRVSNRIQLAKTLAGIPCCGQFHTYGLGNRHKHMLSQAVDKQKEGHDEIGRREKADQDHPAKT